MTLYRPSKLAELKAARAEDGIARAREHALAIKQLVHSEGYPYLKSEALKVVGSVTSKPPVDGSSLIGWFSATVVQWSFDQLFKNLEYIAKHMPEPQIPSSTKRGRK